MRLREDLALSGFTAIGEERDNGQVSEIVLVDCRTSLAPLKEYDHTEHDRIVLAIVDLSATLPVELLADATDIIAYPYTQEELAVRIGLAAYRNAPDRADQVLELGGFKINFTNYEVTIDGVRLDLTYKEYELLRHLATAPGRVFTRSQLLKSVWGYDYIEGARTVDVHIRRLRSKLGSKHAALIETVRHVGYRFKRI